MKKVFFLLSMFATTGVMAQQKDGPNMANRDQASPDFANIQLAYVLAKYGYENKDALSLLNAAKIMASIPTQDANARGIVRTGTEGTGNSEARDTASGKQAISLDPVKLAADAKTFAKGDAATESFVNSTAAGIKPQARGRMGGPAITRERVNGYSTDSYRITFRGNEKAEVALKGDGDTDLDLYVYDENGNLLKYDDDYSDGCYVAWYPKWAGTFIIKVRNRGSVYNRYVMATN